MREAIGGTWLFNIVIFFVILFTGYICLSINHTKAFNVKDDVVKIIERENGFDKNLNDVDETNEIIKSIVSSLKKVGYRSVSSCPNADGGSIWYGFDREGRRSDRDASVCIRKVNVNNAVGELDVSYYQVIVFYQLDLPIFNSLFKFSVKGDTKLLYN